MLATAAATLLCGGALAGFATPALAAYGPGAEPVSVRDVELGDQRSSDPLVSGDGRWVVFRTRSPILLGSPPNAAEYYSEGWLRKDLQTGAIDLVATPERRLRADGSVVAEGVVSDPVAGVSDDGRFVLFGSTAALCCGVQSTITRHVYLRDMTRPRSDASGYELVSAVDGGDGPPEYADRPAGSVPGIAGFSLSDDGRRAVFSTASDSSLPGAGGSATPLGQVFVRDLGARTTRLVTRDREDAALPGTPVAVDAVPRAALSGDGGAVAWAGGGAERQARFLLGEEQTQPPATTHLLWRDLAAGPAATTRRVAGQADPDDPGCPPDVLFVPSPTAAGPCYGPFARPEDHAPDDTILAAAIRGISDDGRRVLFTSNAVLRPYDGIVREAGYLADMTPGLPRKQAVTVPWWDASRFAGLAGDGRHAALVSRRARFDGLQPVGGFQTGDLLTPNLFAVDLDARTIERTTVAPSGADYRIAAVDTGTVETPSLSDDGAVIAFAATDGNLFVGDVNEVADVQAIRRRVDEHGPDGPRRDLPPAPPAPHLGEPPLAALPPVHAIVGRVSVGPRGVATVKVRVPAAGTLTASAKGRVARRGRARAGATVAVGRDRRTLRGPATVRLRIAPSAATRRALQRAPRRVSVRLAVRYAAPAGVSRSDQSYELTGRAPARAKPRTDRERRRARRGTPKRGTRR